MEVYKQNWRNGLTPDIHPLRLATMAYIRFTQWHQSLNDCMRLRKAEHCAMSSYISRNVQFTYVTSLLLCRFLLEVHAPYHAGLTNPTCQVYHLEYLVCRKTLSYARLSKKSDVDAMTAIMWTSFSIPSFGVFSRD